MSNTADKVINIALAQVGYLEKSKTAYTKNTAILDEMTAGAGYDNYTKYGRDMHKVYPSIMDFPASWCDTFVDWCFYMAYGITNAKKLLAGDFNDYTVASAQLYKNKKAWYTTPKVGDQIFFKNATRICHTGLVYKVDAKNVYTIEGNTSSGTGVVANGGAVRKKSYALTYSSIAGYGRPNYDAEETGLVHNGYDYSYVFDASYYNALYPDLRKNLLVTETQLFNHFLSNGIKESRRAKETFYILVYKNAKENEDLRKAFGTGDSDNIKYINHYIQYGRNENRICK